MTEMIGAELELESVHGLGSRCRHHHAGIVDQHIDRLGCRLGVLTHRGQIGEVQHGRVDFSVRCFRANLRRCGLGLVLITACQRHVVAALGQVQSGVVADTGVRSGDDNAFLLGFGHGARLPPRFTLCLWPEQKPKMRTFRRAPAIPQPGVCVVRDTPAWTISWECRRRS